MMRGKILLAVGIILFLGNLSIVAQTSKTESHNITIAIPEVALLDLESTTSSSSFSLNPIAPNEAGNSLDFSNVSNNDIWINYSSIIGTSQPARKVSAFIEATIPEGVVVNVSASSYSGNGKGRNGTPVGNITLTNNAQDIITNIGSCYTGNGINNGHRLTYSLQLANAANSYEKLNFDESATISVTYILTDTN